MNREREALDVDSRIRLLFAAAEQVASDPGLVAPLVEHTGLSRQGVELALREHVERDRDEALVALARFRLPSTPEATVILAANVFVAAFRAVLVASLAARRVWVRSSRREPIFAPKLVQTARNLGATWLDLAPDRELAQIHGAVHVYGRAETVRAVREGVAADVAVYAHGPGFSAAWIPAEQPDLDEAARLVASDMVPFDQRGCLSPRVVFVEDEARARRFADALQHQLAALELQVPRGTLHDEERADWSRALDTWTMAGLAVHEAKTHHVVLAGADAPLALAPVGRAMHVVVAPSAAHVSQVLAPLASQLVALAGDHGTLAGLETTRRCRLGHLQRPPMDGPVDLRVVPTSTG